MSQTVVLDKLRSERDQSRDAAIAMASQEDFDKESDAYKALQDRATALDGQIEQLVNLMTAREAADALDGRMAKASQRQTEERQQTQTGVQTRESWGEQFIRSDAFLNYGRNGRSAKFEVNMTQERALPITLGEMVTAGLRGTILQVDTSAPAAPTPLLDACMSVEVSGNAVEYVAWAKTSGGAATVTEGSAKPPVEYAPTVTPATLEMIAVYTQLTRQLIEDMPAVRSKIDGELRREIAREEEEHAAAALVAATLPTAEGADLLSAIRVGIGTVQAAGYTPNAVVLNPADWAELDVVVMGATLLGPAIGQSFWGLAPIAATSQPAGTATVGDFKAGVEHYFRSAISLFITDSHADTFLSNVFTLLAERRSLTAVVRPAALVECAAGA
jgi:HK97 family phage major capsid protein